METYTWEVLPPELKTQSVVEQLAGKYDWTLGAPRRTRTRQQMSPRQGLTPSRREFPVS
jgi:hypothetical protein